MIATRSNGVRLSPSSAHWTGLKASASSRSQRRCFSLSLRLLKKVGSVVENPVYADYLKRKPEARREVQRQGGLASTSIFHDAETKLESGQDSSPSSTAEDPIDRETQNMAVVLDPQPHVRKRWERKMVIRSIRRRGRLSHAEILKRTERELLSKSHMIKTSVKKLGPLARQIAGKTVDDAIVQMRFSKKLAARSVKDHLEHARNEAIVRRGMALGKAQGTQGDPVQIELKSGKRHTVTDRTNLYIDQAWVGRGEYGRELEHRARGQINILRLPKTSEHHRPSLPATY
jgi:ribosomal protein L22